MKKVGIITWFRGDNYGTVLQATALQYSIDKLGFDSTLIDYKKRINNREIKKIIDLKNRFKSKLFNDPIDKHNISNTFRDKYLKISQPIYTFIELKELNNVYDIFVCGSDQIWSPLNFDEKFFLNFADKNKMISYAPSIGVSSINNPVIVNKTTVIE